MATLFIWMLFKNICTIDIQYNTTYSGTTPNILHLQSVLRSSSENRVCVFTMTSLFCFQHELR